MTEDFKVLFLSPRVIVQITRHVRKTLPYEACGLVFGHREEEHMVVTRCEPCDNRLAGTQAGKTAFEIDPNILFAAHRARGGAMTTRWVGHYHAHPNGRTKPSARDIANIGDVHHVWIIAAVGATSPDRAHDRARRSLLDEKSMVTLTAWRPTADGRGFSSLPWQVRKDDKNE